MPGKTPNSPPDGFVLKDLSYGLDDSFMTVVEPIYARTDDPDNIVTFGFWAQPKHGNIHDMVHGGALFTVADMALGAAIAKSIGAPECVSLSITTDFISAVRVGDWVECEAELLKKGRNVAFVRCTMRVDDKVVLNASGSFAVRENRDGEKEIPGAKLNP